MLVSIFSYSSITYVVKLTGTFHALVYEAVQQRATVVTEGGTGVGVDLKGVLTLQVLKVKRNYTEDLLNTHSHIYTHTCHKTNYEHTHARRVLMEGC